MSFAGLAQAAEPLICNQETTVQVCHPAPIFQRALDEQKRERPRFVWLSHAGACLHPEPQHSGFAPTVAGGNLPRGAGVI